MDDSKLIFLIGPARSGTKIVRNVLSRNSAIDKVDYDINFIWKYMNECVPDDLLTPNLVTEKKRRFVKSYLKKQLTHSDNFVMEKTVSNTVRIPYLLELFPNAKFIFLLRDGLDVIESVNRQWFETPSKKYLLNKMLKVPLPVLLNYVPKFINNISNTRSKSYFWGVHLDEIEKFNTVEEKIAYQWMFCVKSMSLHKSLIPNENIHTIKYENFVKNPVSIISDTLEFISKDIDNQNIDISDISSKSVGKGAIKLSSKQLKLIDSSLKEGNDYLNKLL